MNERLIKAYVEEVVKRVPHRAKEDIEKELFVLIEDEHLEGEKSTEDVLNSLGDPRNLADQYAERIQYIIGPDYYHAYMKTLQLVIPIVWLAIFVSSIVGYVVSGHPGILSIVGSMATSALIVFAFVTIGFSVAERVIDYGYELKTWDVSDLELNVIDKKKISRSEGIIGVIVVVIFFALFNYTPEIFAVYNLEDNMRVSFFNLSEINKILLWFNLAFIIGFARFILKIIVRYYTPWYVIVNNVLNVLGMLAVITVLSSSFVINPEFNQEMILAGFSETVDYIHYIERGISIIIILFIISVIGEFVKEAVKVFSIPKLTYKKKT